MASTAEAAKEFLKTHETSFSNRPAKTVTVETLTYGFQDFLFAPHGPYWKFMKKLCMSELLGGHMLDQFLPLRQQETKRFIKSLLRKTGEAVDFGAEFMTLSNHIVSRMSLSQMSSENENEDEEMRKLVADTAELVGKFNISDFIWFLKRFDLQGFNKRLKEIRDRFDVLMDRIIKEREEERSNKKEMGGTRQFKDMLDVLLDIFRDENSEMKLTKENIKAFIMVSPFIQFFFFFYKFHAKSNYILTSKYVNILYISFLFLSYIVFFFDRLSYIVISYALL